MSGLRLRRGLAGANRLGRRQSPGPWRGVFAFKRLQGNGQQVDDLLTERPEVSIGSLADLLAQFLGHSNAYNHGFFHASSLPPAMPEAGLCGCL